MTGTAMQDSRMKAAVLAVLVAGTLLLSASGSTLAGGSWGMGGGSDEFAISRPDDGQGGTANEAVTPLFSPGGKIGVQGGSDD